MVAVDNPGLQDVLPASSLVKAHLAMHWPDQLIARRFDRNRPTLTV
jgi:hypothetical protein